MNYCFNSFDFTKLDSEILDVLKYTSLYSLMHMLESFNGFKKIMMADYKDWIKKTPRRIVGKLKRIAVRKFYEIPAAQELGSGEYESFEEMHSRTIDYDYLADLDEQRYAIETKWGIKELVETLTYRDIAYLFTKQKGWCTSKRLGELLKQVAKYYPDEPLTIGVEKRLEVLNARFIECSL